MQPQLCHSRPRRHGRWRRCDPNTFCWTYSLDCWISNPLLACPVRRQKHRWLHQLPPHVVWANVAMQRGPFSVTRGHLEDHVLRWLQADPYWSELGRRAADHLAGEEEFKHEVGGYTGRQAPGCNTFNTIDMGRPLQATRVSAWVRCFLQLNRRWLIQLTTEVRIALLTLPQEELRGNGQHFFSTCFSNTALTYGVIKVM